jgi:hypothetical protein
VLTAPAGAGKTSTLGTAARGWQDAGFRVVGLAPSARAAAELAAATGTPADTLAKWLHTHHRDHTTAAGGGVASATALDERTVVIVDEASMASTLDLEPLLAAAAQARAKVVLVGDPAQIGVVNGPGGMLAALASAGHGVDLAEIHRFSQVWERRASLGLRDGRPDALDAYDSAGRLHPCQDGDTALDGVFSHWTAARAGGRDALMLARTRLDVDALNLRARAAALQAGQITGPVTVAGGRDWQAGDVLRARRNDRRLLVGDGHVRNGDRFTVLGPGPDDGVIVQDLAGRGRAVLPADYLAKHVEYGWASTIDSAQGATADVGIVLVRPGLDREHLYVAMTRGRHGNHAYITLDAPSDDEHHDHPHQPTVADAARTPQEQALHMLQAALRHSGAQDAAHVQLAQARAAAAAHATETARQAERAAQQAAERDGAAEQRRRWQARPLTPEHNRAVQQLEQTRAERERLQADRDALRQALRAQREQLEELPRWAYRRRRALTASVAGTRQSLRLTDSILGTLDGEIERLTRQVAHHSRRRVAGDLAVQQQHRARAGTWHRSAPPDAGELARLLLERQPCRAAVPDSADGLSL